MDSLTAKRFENVEFRLTGAEEKIVRQNKILSAIRKLILTGMKMVAENQKGMKELREGMKELREAQKALTNAQIATEDSLRRWLDRQNNGHS